MRLPTRLLQRKTAAHKGNFGHIFILAGCAQFSGAAALCSDAAMRAGAGLVTLGVCRQLIKTLIKKKSAEVMLEPLVGTPQLTLSSRAYSRIKKRLGKIDVLVIGPGLGQDSSTQTLIRKVIANTNKPMVIDADGLNALVGKLDLLQPGSNKSGATKILTPHPGEMAKLLGVSVSRAQDKRRQIARKFARDYKITLVLKGHQTVISDYQGNLYINKTGNPGMATAGSGDVLSGMIGALLGQGLTGFQAAKYAVYLHGLAGDLAAKKKTQVGMIASDIIEMIPRAIKLCS